MSLTYGSDYEGYWLFPCATVPSFSFNFGGSESDLLSLATFLSLSDPRPLRLALTA
jgi:hypothetical protein